MAKSYTKTQTKTMARPVFLELQIMSILSTVVTNFTDGHRDTISKGITKELIETFIVYGKTKDNKVKMELRLKVDWKRHTLEMKRNAEVVLQKEWGNDGVINQLRDFAYVFKNAAEQLGLLNELVYIIRSDTDLAEARKILDLVPSEPAEWVSNERQGDSFHSDYLSELGATFTIVK